MLRLAELNADQDPMVGSFGARAALWAGDGAGVSADLAASEAIGKRGRALGADRTTMRAGLAALDGRTSDALEGYRAALAIWRDLGLAWDEALACLDMATLLDPASTRGPSSCRRCPRRSSPDSGRDHSLTVSRRP